MLVLWEKELRKIGFLGAGQMATALASGFVRAGLVADHDIVASDPSGEAKTRFRDTVGNVVLADSNADVARNSEILIIAVKPPQVAGVLGEIAATVRADALIVSIAAGVRLAVLEGCLGPQSRLIRVMPNTPCLLGKGACAYCLGGAADDQDAAVVESLLGAVGLVCRVEEKLMDAVTGLSGSGPAFGYLMIEAMSDGGVHQGLPRGVATKLAAQTLLGAAEMVLQTGEHPGVLKDRVTSPGGTTIAGIRELENLGVRRAVMGAVIAASERSAELGATK